MLLRVSSNQQLDADGDLTIQRQLVAEYIKKQRNWILDEKEYFEGSNSGYNNAVTDRAILQEIKKDAEGGEFDILVCYKDDRVGRRMWEVGAYVMELKKIGVDIYTVKDGCISPQTDDIMGQMVLALRYGNAQKSSSDTGMRVKDTAKKLVQEGRFVGGRAPFGYELVYSGEISRHGRALKKLQIIWAQAEVVRYIYRLSMVKEYGSSKIAKELNLDPYYHAMAPNSDWRSGTVTGILTNPVYCGYMSYNRREKKDGRYRTTGSCDRFFSEKQILELVIIPKEQWEQVQTKRKLRSQQYAKTPENAAANVIGKNDGMLALIDVAYCGCCGRKLTNGTKYNYWTIKETGERRASRSGAYKCPGAWEGGPHENSSVFRADQVEAAVFESVGTYLEFLNRDVEIMEEIQACIREKDREQIQRTLRVEMELEKMQEKIRVMETHIPDAVAGEYPISAADLGGAIRMQRELCAEKKREIAALKKACGEEACGEEACREKACREKACEKKEYGTRLTWKDVFENADHDTQRVVINKLVKRIYIKRQEIHIEFNYLKNDHPDG
ncbi:recombinase family protein [Hespellia stercorisuis]|uniref:Recombinase zinc beta ribbon domain-containing protein n=1 Tax=Hespellia stercorisuis DSM 15480 TaxID=1121950 RepID=A0A1M6LXR2_9FIRM|nr:recombinase family protein [Hespellia stercorisuis]SHJ76047.1 Recombinase zinc beta ribbon domain-containing protein [Hespellia stercorisuis DSM 15480]